MTDIIRQQKEAKAAGLKHVTTMLQIPDQLDKVGGLALLESV